MNVLMILDDKFPPDPRVENEAKVLMRDGHKVSLLCVDYSYLQSKTEKITGIYVSRIRPPKYIYTLSALAYSIPFYHYYFQKVLADFIKKNDVDTIHIHDIQVARSVFNMNKRFNLPVVLDLHENRPEIMKHYSHVNSILGKLIINPHRWKKFEYKYIKRAQKVIVVTDEAKNYYIKETNTGEDNFCVVPNSVQPEFYEKYDIEERIISKYSGFFTILYIGDTGLRRGLVTVIKALKYLVPEINNIKLVFVGNNKTDNILKDLVKENKWDKYVDFVGWQQPNLFQSYIIASAIGICPIHRNLHHDTTYANKIFQYLAFSKPIVVSNCTAQQKLVEKYNCGLVFKDRDVRDFANSIITLYKNKELYNKLSLNAESSIKEKLNWEILSKDLVDVYKSL